MERSGPHQKMGASTRDVFEQSEWPRYRPTVFTEHGVGSHESDGRGKAAGYRFCALQLCTYTNWRWKKCVRALGVKKVLTQ
jgi:hypothetical protein